MSGSKQSMQCVVRRQTVSFVWVTGLLLAMTGLANADFVFGEPENLGSIVNSSDWEGEFDISSDGLEMYFGTDRPGGRGKWDVWVTTRATTDDDWGAPVNLGPIVNGVKGDWAPSISADKLSLYFSSDRPGSRGYCDLWVTTRTSVSGAWGEPVNLGPTLNSSAWQARPSISTDGLSLFFSSNREKIGTSYEELCDIFVTTRPTTNDPWIAPVRLGPTVNLGLEYDSDWPSISEDGLSLYFSHWILDDDDAELWVATRTSASDSWNRSVNLGLFGVTPKFSSDGLIMYFASSSYGGYGDADLFQVSIQPMLDLNGDDEADSLDISVLMNQLGREDTLCDIGPTAFGDGIVDEKDLAVFSECVEIDHVVLHAPISNSIESPRDTVLSWTPVDATDTYDVYFGTSFEDVSGAERANPEGVPISQGQSANSYDPAGSLERGQTYYWRIDVVSSVDATIHRGFVWNFTTEAIGYPIEHVTATASSALAGAGPENTINGSGLDKNDLHSTSDADMWLCMADGPQPVWIQYEFDKPYKLHEMLVWNYNVVFERVLGFGLRNVTITYSEDGATWKELGEVELAKASAQGGYACNTMVDLAGVKAKFVRLTVNSNWNGALPQYGLSEIRFLQIPTHATEPEPSDGQANTSTDLTLHWNAGREAVSREVHFSTDEEAVAASTALVATVDETSYWPGPLDLGRTYYWKVNEVNEAEAIGVWEGDVWSFSTEEYVTVEGFEGYTDDIEAERAIWQTWIDGWINDTGSTVGYAAAPFVEHAIRHGGWQSMPLAYDNTDAPFYSEAQRTFDTPQNWTGNGADTLRLCLRGTPVDFLERDDGTIVMYGGGTDIWDNADEFRFAYQQLTGDGSIIARVESLEHTHNWAKAGVMVRDSLDSGSRHALVCLTPSKGVAFLHRFSPDSFSVNVNQTGVAAPHWVRLTRTENKFKAEQSQDGTNWFSITSEEADSSMSIPMSSSVYIGLALTSHNPDQPTTAEFSNVALSGDIVGPWRVEAIGAEQPDNDPAPLYVTLEDSSGNAVTVGHPDPQATVLDSWQEWLIPFGEFDGVDLASVQTMYIGVGDPDSQTAGGTGLIYIDDIGFGHTLSLE